MESVKQKTEEEIQSEVGKIFEEMLKRPEISEALDLLDSLPENLKYHNKAHTLDVLKETILFAIADGASIDVIELVSIAAAWHDVGYIKQYDHNEPIAVKLFKASKAFKLLSREQREEIINIILDTQLVMKDDKPHLFQKRSRYGYVLDGDVSNFGREDFFDRSALIAAEFNLDLSDISQKKKFFVFALELLKNHEWKTKSAKRLRQKQKEANLKKLKEYIPS